ncbi:MAG: PAS domain S-box protein, partial [Mariprofundaceae bacterium]|nr:PAS domain S-box protein [Mariprofundaceae bacterium]
IIGAWIDVSERKEFERERSVVAQRMAASEARYRRLVELSSVCIHEIDLQGKLLSMNAAGLRMNCVSAEADVLGRPYLNGVASDERAAIALLLEQAMQGKPSEFEFHGAGAMSDKVFSSNFVAMFDADNRVEKIMGISEDITDRKQAEAALKASEARLEASAERFRSILDADFDAVLVHKDMRVVFSNKAAQEMFGFASLEETIGVNPQDFMDPAFKSLAAMITRKIIRTGKPGRRIELGGIDPVNGHIFPMEIASAPITWGDQLAVISVLRDITQRKQQEQFILASSEPFPMEISSTPIEWGGRPALVSNIRDISERKQAALAIAERENKFRELVRMVPDALIVHQDGRLVFANDAAVRLFGFESLEAVTGVEVIKYV